MNKAASIIFIVVLPSILSNTFLHSRVKQFSSEKGFYAMLHGAGELAVVLMYMSPEKKRKMDEGELARYKMQRNLHEQLLSSFKHIEQSSLYKEAGVAFLYGDAARKELSELINSLGVVAQFPTVLLFKDGQIVQGNDGIPVSLKGESIVRPGIRSFIDDNFGDAIDELIDIKDKERQRLLQEAKIRSYTMPGWYGYPWYGSPYYGWYW